jgi:chromosome segregation ATPase
MLRAVRPWLLCVPMVACFNDSPSPASAPQPTPADLDALCAARVETGAESAALAAQERVDSIAQRLSDREGELARLEQEMRNDAKRAKAAKAERDRIQGEVDSLRKTLGDAEKDRDKARSELVATLKQLDSKIAEAEAAKQDAQRQRERAEQGEWAAFVASAKNDICDRGTRKRHDRCHEAVETALTGELRARFDACTASEQAAPELRQLDKDGPLPEFAERIPDDRAFTQKNWAIVFCDPALPETE